MSRPDLAPFVVLAGTVLLVGCGSPSLPPADTQPPAVNQGDTKMAALLPESLESESVSSMSVGEEAWTVPWAMWVDSNRRMWLHPGYLTEKQPRGTAAMLVVRRADGYHVDVARCRDHGWTPRAEPSYVGSEGVEWVPVVSISGHQ